MASIPRQSHLETRLISIVFALALGFHVWGATRGWNQINLIGCEFRQTQTAVSALFIQREQNFSLAYPTPVLGKPWAIPLEFPLYQWTVVKLSDWTGLSLTHAGRSVSLICFYLGLPALWGLLAYVGLNRSRRLLVMTFVVSCPLYIFYAQAFLIETMAWMFALWFCLGTVHAVDRRRGPWWLLAVSAGVAAGLVKITTLLFFLLPLTAFILWRLWQERPIRQGGSWLAWRHIFLRSVVSLGIPFLLALAWTHYADAVKVQSIAGAFLESAHQRGYVFGLGKRFSWELWRQHLPILLDEIAPVPVLAIAAIAIAYTRRWIALTVLLVGCFFLVQEIFPILYAWHSYYYVANAVALMAAVGLAMEGLFSSRLPRVLVWIITLGLLGCQVGIFFKSHYPILTDAQPRDNVIPRVLRLATQPDDVVIISGADWDSIVPFYSERRAFMIRFEKEKDYAFIEKVFIALKGEPVKALMLQNDQRFDAPLLAMVLAHFHLDPRPVFESEKQRIYLAPERRERAMAEFDSYPPTTGVDLAPESRLDPARFNGREILWDNLPQRSRQYFKPLQQVPWKFFALYGVAEMTFQGRSMLFASTDSKLWFRCQPGHRRVAAECAIYPDAYSDAIPPGDRSDGVEFTLSEVLPDGTIHQLATLFLNPAQVPSDRTLHRLEFVGEIAAGAQLLLETKPGPRGSYARDWSLLGRVSIE
jgi:Dolichyl-phosphate-mannose-protein mannosyltransferase